MMETVTFETHKVGAMAAILMELSFLKHGVSKSGFVTVNDVLREAQSRHQWKKTHAELHARAWVRAAASKLRKLGLLHNSIIKGQYKINDSGKRWAKAFIDRKCMVALPSTRKEFEKILTQVEKENKPKEEKELESPPLQKRLAFESPGEEVYQDNTRDTSRVQKTKLQEEKTTDLPSGIRVRYETREGNLYHSLEEASTRVKELSQLEELLTTWLQLACDMEGDKVPLERVVEAILNPGKWEEVRHVRP